MLSVDLRDSQLCADALLSGCCVNFCTAACQGEE
jgi:hypothetical protein